MSAAKANSKPLSAKKVASLVSESVERLGGLTKAGLHWNVSAEMVRMVIKGRRRPTPAMLRELRLQEIRSEIRYRPE